MVEAVITYPQELIYAIIGLFVGTIGLYFVAKRKEKSKESKSKPGT